METEGIGDKVCITTDGIPSQGLDSSSDVVMVKGCYVSKSVCSKMRQGCRFQQSLVSSKKIYIFKCIAFFSLPYRLSVTGECHTHGMH